MRYDRNKTNYNTTTKKKKGRKSEKKKKLQTQDKTGVRVTTIQQNKE